MNHTLVSPRTTARSTFRSALTAALAAVAVTLAAPAAFAGDGGLPANHCPVENLGQSCDKAGPSMNQPGVCAIGPCGESETCSYCQVPDGGSSTTTNDAAATKDAGNNEPSMLEGSSGCTIGAGAGSPLEGAWLFALGGVGYVAATMSRRKRAR